MKKYGEESIVGSTKYEINRNTRASFEANNATMCFRRQSIVKTYESIQSIDN